MSKTSIDIKDRKRGTKLYIEGKIIKRPSRHCFSVWSLSSILIIHDTNAINSPTTLAITSDDIHNDSETIVLGSPF